MRVAAITTLLVMAGYTVATVVVNTIVTHHLIADVDARLSDRLEDALLTMRRAEELWMSDFERSGTTFDEPAKRRSPGTWFADIGDRLARGLTTSTARRP